MWSGRLFHKGTTSIKKRVTVVVCGRKWLLEGAGVEVAKVGGQVGGEGGARNQRFTGEDAPSHAELLVVDI